MPRGSRASRRDIAVLQKESSSLEGEEDVKMCLPCESSVGFATRRISKPAVCLIRRRGVTYRGLKALVPVDPVWGLW
jgi:hypothetical protein